MTKGRLVLTREQQVDFVRSLQVDDEKREEMASMTQGEEPWMQSRYGRLTGSKVGAAVGRNFHCPHVKLLSELLWNTFQGNEATTYGQVTEPKACEVYANYRRTKPVGFKIRHAGLFVHEKLPFFAYSPDALVEEEGVPGLLEIKCPFKKKFYGRIPKYYYDQIQFGMFITKRIYCDFVVYLPDQTLVERYSYNAAYVEQFLLPNALRFYFKKYLPLLLAKKNGWLREGECVMPEHIAVEYLDVPRIGA